MKVDPKVEAVARAISSAKGHNPEEQHWFEGFSGPEYFENWVTNVTEAKVFIATYDALLPKQGA